MKNSVSTKQSSKPKTQRISDSYGLNVLSAAGRSERQVEMSNNAGNFKFGINHRAVRSAAQLPSSYL